MNVSPLSEATLIYNPSAGVLTLKQDIEGVVEFWQARGWRVYVRATRYAGHAEAIAREAAKNGHRMVLAAGGDGTLGEVTNGLAHTETILAPLPGGTGNSFAKELQLPLRKLFGGRDLVRACRALAGGRVHRIDVGKNSDGKYWLQWTGAGADGYLIKHMEPRDNWIRRLGTYGYFGKAFLSLPAFQAMKATIKVDDLSFSGLYLMITVSNCRRYAGGMIVLTPEAVLDDGFLEVWLFEGDNFFDMLKTWWRLRRGQHIDHPGITCIRGREVQIITERPALVHRDGDPAGSAPLQCRIDRQALRLLLPDSAPGDLVGQPGEALT